MVKAKLDGFLGFRGRSVWVSSGDERDESDPLVQANRHMFTPPPQQKEEPRRLGRPPIRR